jgi:hypothetical protein
VTSHALTDDYRRSWTNQLSLPDALIIGGNLYFVGPEPATADLLANPKQYGCYGTGFTIGRSDGTQVITHNLGCCGEIPAALRPADNAAFIGEPQTVPLPAIPVHDHFDHLDYIGGSYPYECVVCHLRFAPDEVPADVAAEVINSFGPEVY